MKKWTLVELAEQYSLYHDELCLEELARRDNINKMTYDEQVESFVDPDNQDVFDFHKNPSSRANASIEWNEAYDSGVRAGVKIGIKEAQSCDGIKEEGIRNEKS